MNDFQNKNALPPRLIFCRCGAKPSAMTKWLRFLSLGLVILGIYGVLGINPMYIWLLTIALYIWWKMWFHSNTEYEYTYFDGELEFDKITDKSRRKTIGSIHMENVELIAPVGHGSLYNAHKNTFRKIKDLSSGKKDVKAYDIVWREAGDIQIIRFEPDEEFLNHISIKYGSKIKK